MYLALSFSSSKSIPSAEDLLPFIKILKIYKKNISPDKIQTIIIIKIPGVVFHAFDIGSPLLIILVRSTSNHRPNNNEAIKTAQHLAINTI